MSKEKLTYSGVATRTIQGNPPPVTHSTPHWVRVCISTNTPDTKKK